MTINTEPVHGPPKAGLVFMALAMCGAVLGLLLVACGSPGATKISTAAATPACDGVSTWAHSTAGPGELAEMKAAITGITADLRSQDTTQLQADGMALSQITGMDVVADAPPIGVNAWAKMVLDLNKAGQALVGGDTAVASGYITLAHSYASDLSSALHECGAG